MKSPEIKSPELNSNKLRVVHSSKRQEPDNNRSQNVKGEPGVTNPKPSYYPRNYSPDAVSGNYQGL